MKVIEKKIDPLYLRAIMLGLKTFELRKEDDVTYEVNDILVLRAYDINKKQYIKDDYALVQVTSILRGYDGLQDGYVVLSFKVLEDVR